MRTQFDLSDLSWKLAGFMPYGWHCANYPAIVPTPKIGVAGIEVEAIPARVPGSVQGALREAGVIPDWNEGLNSRQSEWVESRHWVYETFLPDDWLAKGRSFRLVCLGLDYAGWVVLNGRVIGEFRGSLVPHMFDFTGLLAPSINRLQIARLPAEVAGAARIHLPHERMEAAFQLWLGLDLSPRADRHLG